MSTVRWGAPFIGPRLRVRRVDTCLDGLATRARDEHRWLFETRDGGTVANKYGYPAETEVLLAVVAPDGRIAAWGGRASANKAGARSAALHALARMPFLGPHHGDPVDYFDGRVGSERRDAGENALKCLWFHVWREFTPCVWCAARVYAINIA